MVDSTETEEPSVMEGPNSSEANDVLKTTESESKGTIVAEGLNSTSSRSAIISGVTVAVVVIVVAVIMATVLVLCAALTISKRRRKEDLQSTPEVTPDQRTEIIQHNSVATSALNQSLHEYEALDSTLANKNHHVRDGPRETQPESQPKPGDPDFKQDLSLSQSFHSYEVMNANIRGSRSCLLAAVEEGRKGGGEKQKEGEEDNASKEEKEEQVKQDEEKKQNDSIAETAHSSDQKVGRLISIGDCSDCTKDPPSRPYNLSSESSESSFTGLAHSRVRDAESEPLNSTVFEEEPADKKLQKPAPLPRKLKTAPSLSSLDNVAIADEEVPREATPTDYISTTYPRKSKPKPKPRQAKKSESSAKGDEITDKTMETQADENLS